MPASAKTGCRPEPLPFDRLLQWLDDGVDSHGDRLLEMHGRLVSYFDRYNRLAPEQLADETFRRIASTIAMTSIAGTASPAHYCYVVARSILHEDIRRERTESLAGGALTPPVSGRAAGSTAFDDGSRGGEPRANRLDRCFTELPVAERQLIVEYYRDANLQGAGYRRRMAERMGISQKALGVRAFQIRQKLMSCVNCSEALR